MKLRNDAKLMTLLDQTANIVANNFAKNLIDHGHIRFAPYMIAKLCLDHRKGTLNIAALVVMPQELIAAVMEVVKHLLPQAASLPGMLRFERDEWHAAVTLDRIVISAAAISLIRRHFRQLSEIRSGVSIRQLVLNRQRGLPC